MANQGTYVISARPENDPRCAGVPLLFRKSFPGVLLKDFHYTHAAYDPKVWMAYEGLETDLLGYGLVTPNMLAAPPKRKAFGWHGANNADSWGTERSARKRVRVTLHGLPDLFPALAPFAAECFPWFESNAAQHSYCQTQINADAEALSDAITALARGVARRLQEHGFRWHEGVAEELEELAEQYACDLAQRIRTAPIESACRPSLSLVVDNSRI